MFLNCGVGGDIWESLGQQGDPTSPSKRRSVLNINWKDWCWSWNSNTLAIWCKEVTHLKRPWCWEWRQEKGMTEVKNGWIPSPTQWTWVWVNSRSGDWQGGLVCCSPWGCKELNMTERLNWTELVGWMVKNLPSMQETLVQSLGWEDPLEKGMATHSSILAWRIP